MIKSETAFTAFALLLVTSMTACSGRLSSQSPPAPTPTAALPDRESRIPENALKISPQTDPHPPLLYVEGFEAPVPVPGGVNTAGAEDSPFISPDGETLTFFFTPDVAVPVEEQVRDGVTGIYQAELVNGRWGRPERVLLQEPGLLAGDGCPLVLGDTLWFCSAREGYTGLHWFTARRQGDRWTDWEPADFDPAYQVGEFHLTADGAALYFASERPGGRGGLDIWRSRRVDGAWGEPVNLAAVNTAEDEGWPALNPAGDELWFSRAYGVWRSIKVNDAWGPAELVVSPLSGEPTVDAAGNLYFVHHYFEGDQMIEADIYVACRK